MAEAPVATPVNGVAEKVEETPGVKLYVGNLKYGVKDEDLKAFFAPVQSKILSAQVIMHGVKSAGYGFVSVSDDEAAREASETLNGQDLQGRLVKVEIAKPVEQKEKERTERKKRRQGRRGSKAAAGEVTEAEANGEVEKPQGASETEGGEGKPRKKKSVRSKRKPKTDTVAAGSAEATEGSGAPTSAAEDKKAPKPKRTPKPKRAAGEEPVGEPSKTTLFVANLPFELDDEGLGAIFTGAGFDINSARVVRMRWGHPTRRSKGYGFVDFKSEETQKAAMEKLQGHEHSGRQLAIKIAVDAPNRGEDAVEEAEGAEAVEESTTIA